MPEPTQPATKPNADGATKPPEPNASFDPSKLTASDLEKVLELPELWKNSRLKKLMDSDKELDQLKSQQSKDQDKNLEEQKKWQELAEKRLADNEALTKQVQDLNLNQSLSSELTQAGVIDVNAALKLIGRDEIKVENGTVTGSKEAIEALQASSPYLFNPANAPAPTTVGTPTNQGPSTPPSGNVQYTFKESQLTPAFIKENEAAILQAERTGMIEPDGSPPMQ